MKKVFIKHNENPLGNQTGDCVVRALSHQTGHSWDIVYAQLFSIGYDRKEMPSCKSVYSYYLEELEGFEYISLSKNLKGKKRPRVRELAREGVDGVYKVANHLVSAKGGQFFDTWDSGDACVYGYWTKK